jgi:hypothetical protein
MPREVGQKSPRTKCIGLRARAWWVIRRSKRFTLPDLLCTLADGSQKDPAANLKKYLARLVKVGILDVAKDRKDDGKLTSNGLYDYRLARDLGPKAPVAIRDSLNVLDPNSGQVLEPKDAQEEPDRSAAGERI